MTKIVALTFVFLAGALNSGCATLADAQADKGSGTSKVYDRPYDVVWNATLESVKSSSLKLASENKDKGIILAQHAVNLWSWGEEVAIFVTHDGANTRVEVVYKARLTSNITATNWDKVLLDAIDKRL
jgi:hypothetical protein